jgi:crotonobetaine/carnitine-CoA ligase
MPPAAVEGDLTLPELLAEAARRWPAKVFLRIDQRAVTFLEFAEDVERLAGALHEDGLRPGDRVCVLMPNSLACVRSWFAVNRAGGVWVPLNTEFVGEGLAHALRLAGPRLVICDYACAERLREPRVAAAIESSRLTIAHAPEGAVTDSGCLEGRTATSPAPPVSASPAELSALLYTSGTTGHSKACMLSHRYFTSQARIAIRDFGLRHDDVLYCPFPLFHADATALTTVPALLTGATAAIGRRFSASRFWQEVRDVGATVFDFMGATLTILNKAEQQPDDADNPVRLAWGVPVPSWAPDFERRFGLKILEVYGSTESNLPVTQRFDQVRVPGSCGRVTPEFEIRIADDNDDEVERGEAGEILTRPKIAHTVLEGYFGMADATAEAFRGLWFHTGDLGRLDADGNLFFLGRKKDSIRRRGENISAFEVEEAINANAAVLESAAFGVPSDLTEEDVKVSVVLRPDMDVTHSDILRFCADTMPRFQVPRYIEIVAELPKTPTGKVAKGLLRAEPFTSSTWDQEASGFVTTPDGNGNNGAGPGLVTD